MIALGAMVVIVLAGCARTSSGSTRPSPSKPLPPAASYAEAAAICGCNLPLELRSKIDPFLQAKCFDWKLRGETTVAPSETVLIELASSDTRDLERAGVAFKPLFENFFSARIRLDALIGVAELESVLRIHYDQPTKPNFVTRR
jgi:hypothetical protein